MANEWHLSTEAGLLKALLALSPKRDTSGAGKKINLPAQGPTPDAKVKSQLNI